MWFSGGCGNARLIVGLNILVVFSSLNDTMVLWCYDSKCMQSLSVCMQMKSVTLALLINKYYF